MFHNDLDVSKEYAGFFSKLRYVACGAPLLLVVFIGIALFLFYDGSIALFISFVIILLPTASLLFAVSIYSLNQFPIIKVVEQGIVISNNFGNVLIPWEQIEAVKGDRRFPLGRVYVFSEALPRLYCFYGLERLRWSRAFIVDPTLSVKTINKIVSFIAVNNHKTEIEILY